MDLVEVVAFVEPLELFLVVAAVRPSEGVVPALFLCVALGELNPLPLRVRSRAVDDEGAGLGVLVDDRVPCDPAEDFLAVGDRQDAAEQGHAGVEVGEGPNLALVRADTSPV